MARVSRLGGVRCCAVMLGVVGVSRFGRARLVVVRRGEARFGQVRVSRCGTARYGRMRCG